MECIRCKEKWDYSWVDSRNCPKCGLQPGVGKLCEICGTYIRCGAYDSAVDCPKCGQHHEYDEDIHVILTDEQRELLRVWQGVPNKGYALYTLRQQSNDD